MSETAEDTRHVNLHIGHVEKITTKHRYNRDQANEILDIAMKVAKIAYEKHVRMTANPVSAPEDR